MTNSVEAISSVDFSRLRGLIYKESGINLSADKKTMLELRIRRRLRTLHLDSYDQYCKYLFGDQGMKEEIIHLLDVVTTNKTDFFREPDHFEFLTQHALPDLLERNGTSEPFLIWSAGCSTGEEPYTLAMVLSEFGLTQPGFRFQILATDISTTVLEKARQAVFDSAVVQPVPAAMRRKYFMRSRKSDSEQMRVVPELRRTVEFRRLNFMDADFGVTQPADAIFCRNVIIYFDRPTQEKILQKLSARLVPGGYVFVGHSESLHDMDLPLSPVAPALYRKQ